MMAVTEEVYLQCFKNKIKKKPAPNTIRARILALSDHLRVEKREGKKRAAEKYEPIKGHFPGADQRADHFITEHYKVGSIRFAELSTQERAVLAVKRQSDA